ncbi:MAG: CtsR family transcriptional regulator [Alkalibacterium sp.]|nr:MULTISPECIES: CtsR family transcriptional regulator [Alkalibacterium]MDN6195514.1 CtsR family transcriptional regulator [Atopostipes suicloacalis]MDN6294519.1 CtsR family transcriptional regulator [Alkalibacterium sp.]MDN6296135.1 CtsR family transcriptional regulator [Alkalibacterium sp.]MDN6326881.1 CtsR family transcriptional regulator [Alkalibacterium sp.]MDN6730255.1 CtsR family transcriptional regulator [Alkalibacterium sp.]
MENKNMTDIIEAYLKKVLKQKEQVEIRRSEIAELFDCVPSQINYVINTRFTIQKGYLVESKRGGGGYIRIIKVQVLDELDMLNTMVEIVGNSITERDAKSVVQRLYDDKIITKREAKLMIVAMDKSLYTGNRVTDNRVRANLLRSMLVNLCYEEPNKRKAD